MSRHHGMRERVERVAADLAAFDRQWSMPFAPAKRQRLLRYHQEELEDLASVPYELLCSERQTDWVLLRRYHERQTAWLRREATQESELTPWLPFAVEVENVEEARRTGRRLEAPAVASGLQGIADTARGLQDAVQDGALSRSLAWRVSKRTEALRTGLKDVHAFYDGYDPSYSWWARAPYSAADQALADYAAALKERVVGVKPDDDEAIVGVPIGEEALLEELHGEGLAHVPEELIAAAEAEWVWCVEQMGLVADEMGFADWRDAREYVKTMYVAPGEQAHLVRELAGEAIEFLRRNDLVTIPPLAEEAWRVQMMPPERQLVAPFFLGGECILVSYPTDSMQHPSKQMALRGNNRHFARATVQHELIPGHHLQFFMTQRHQAHRRLFSTAFWIEGWALHWEMLLWDIGFATSPEDRIGMLFWRMHRASRVIWSLRFHLGQMSTDECIGMLVDDVGHERATAEGEVRRSFGGEYGPLYQAAYLIGGLQMRALHAEKTGSHKAFHDAVLREGPIPLEALRYRLKGEAPPRDWAPAWRFL